MIFSLFAQNTVSLSHQLFTDIVIPGDLIVDATCGNGKDSLFLAKLLCGEGRLVVYDIQEQAINNTKALLRAQLTEREFSILEFKQQSHEHINEQGAKLFHYNLGYLPKGDKSITTVTKSTLASIQMALGLLAPQGVVSVVCYPGHREGNEEMLALEDFSQTLSPKLWKVSSYSVLNRRQAPRLLLFQSLLKKHC